MRNRSFVVTLLLTFSPSAIAVAAQQTGTISGTVVTAQSAPLSGAKVTVDPVDDRPRGSLVRQVETDAAGRFLVDRLIWGRYKVFAKKEAAGYPAVEWSFYSDDVFPIVAITPNNPLADVTVQLGPQGASLSGLVKDASNGSPVSAGFKLTRAASPDKWISLSQPPDYRVLMPPSTDVLVEVSAAGFKTWSPAGTLRLGPGAEMHLDIALEPSHDPSLHPSKFLVPNGYVGWLLLEYNVKEAEPVPTQAGARVFEFPLNGTLSTSSLGPQRGAEDEYWYYSADGSLREIPTDYRNGTAKVWGQHEGTRNGTLSQFGFFVGSEEQYKKYQARATHPGPISNP